MESIGTCRGVDDIHALEATELRLGLPGTCSSTTKRKRPLDADEPTSTGAHEPTVGSAPPAKSPVVGWPPVQAFRKNACLLNQRHLASKASSQTSQETSTATPTPTPSSSPGFLVKVSMDGAPYLRKIDLGAYKNYKDLCPAVDAMFGCSISSASHQELTYQDKDGDWMLVGDIPWEMFASSCQRLRIIKASCGGNRA